ncbi:hypothetical protein BsWGS_10405 [Bradybaena similaris]
MLTSNNFDDSDLARRLQEEYDREAALILDDDGDDKRRTESAFGSSWDTLKPFVPARQSFMPELSPVDPSLELSDPTPDIYLLFLDFNQRYFWGSLSGVEVKWSPRMTLCAGLCVYEGRGGLCSVRLSLPLLKLRPRKDLVETLLHEMIHAYLFVTDNDRDHSGHGPNFLSHMNRLNKATGANISVYHTFNDEVDSYQQHWWRCNGPCQSRPPYFGYVKRSMNRAPSAKDFWWPEHQATCWGAYTKIKEPEGFGQKKLGKSKAKEVTDNALEPSKGIRAFLGKGHTLSSATESNNKAGGASLSKGKPKTNPVNAATFSGRTGSNTKSRQTSVDGALPKPLYNNKNISAVKSASNPLANKRSEVSASQDFQQPANKQNRDKCSTSLNATNVETETSANNHNRLMDIRNKLPHESLSLPTKRKVSAANNAGSDLKVVNTNSRSKFHRIFDKNSFSSNAVRKKSPHMDNKKVVFPKNFVSVCVSGESSGPAVSSKNKKKKYIIDELDSNDGLWEETINLTTDVNLDDLSNECTSFGRAGHVNGLDKMSEEMNKCPVGLTDHRSDTDKKTPTSKPFQTNTQSSDKTDMKSNEIKIGNRAVKSKSDDLSFLAGTRPGIDNLGSRSSTSLHGAITFTGEGYKLGTGESGSSFLSQIRKTWQQKSGITASASSTETSHSSPESRLFQLSRIDHVNASSSLQNKKRTSVEAFGAQEVNNLDKKKTVKIDNEMTSHNDSNIRHTLVSEPLNGASHTETPDTHVKVPCPVCNVLVIENTINAHLDLCLLGS